MTFRPALWYPIAVVLSLANLIAIGFAGGSAHAMLHGVLGLAFGLWAQRLRLGPREGGPQPRVEALEAEVSELQRQLSQTQDGLDFAERLLAQRPESRRLDLQRDAPKQPEE